jgi:thioredoxin reductase (NADPH)
MNVPDIRCGKPQRQGVCALKNQNLADTMQEHELVIIGAGPAGASAGIYARRAGLDVLLLESGNGGSQICNTLEVENWPGLPNVSGPELDKSFRKHAAHLGCIFARGDVLGLEEQGGRHIIRTSKGEYAARAVIIASGATHRRLGCPGESTLAGAGVSYCAVCDAPFYEGEAVAVVGGGNTAVEEALYLTRFASKVYIVHRRDSFRADSVLASRALANEKIIPVWNSTVASVNGSDMVEGLTVRNTASGEYTDIEVAGVFVCVGIEPNTAFVDDRFQRTAGGWLATNTHLHTSVAGVFAAGDVRDTPLRQIVTAAADGALAAISVYHWLQSR